MVPSLSLFENPQTDLKTADLTSATVRQRPPRFDYEVRQSMIVRPRPRSTAGLAVISAGHGPFPVEHQGRLPSTRY